MPAPFISSSEGPGGQSFYLMAYVEGNDGTGITQVAMASITYTIYRAGTAQVVASGSLVIGSVVFDTPVQTDDDPRWRAREVDYPGYNFAWQVPASLVPTGLDTYRIVIVGTEAGAAGLAWSLRHDRKALNDGTTSTTPNLIVLTRGTPASRTLPLLGNIASRTKLWFTVKDTTTDPDDEAILALTEAGGLITVNGSPASNAALGSLTVTNSATGAVTLWLDATVMALLDPVHALFWDSQVKIAGVVSTPKRGHLTIRDDVTRET